MIYYFIGIIALLGIMTSYEDIVRGKIRNIWILTAVFSAVILYLLVILFKSPDYLSAKYFLNLILNLAITLVVAVVLWLGYIWSAADAKLFICYSILIPLTAYTHNNFSVFPSFNLLINSFVPFFLFYFIRLLPNSIKEFRKKSFFGSYLFPLIGGLFVISWVSRAIIILFNMPNDYLLNFILVFLMYIPLAKFTKKWAVPIIIVLSLARLAIDFKTVATYSFLLYFTLLILIFSIIRLPTLEKYSSLFSKEIEVINLKKGMLLEEGVYYDPSRKSYRKINLRLLSAQNNDRLKQVIDHVPEGITYDDVKKIGNLFKQGRLPFNKIRIFHTYPFAPFMFVGAIITLIGGGTFIKLIMLLFGWL